MHHGGEMARWRPWLCAQPSFPNGTESIGVRADRSAPSAIALGVVMDASGVTRSTPLQELIKFSR